MFFAANAGKRSAGASTSSRRAGAALVLRLVDRADVVVQSLRPGAAARLGLGPDELRARNPRLVYCSIGAFGRGGPLAGEPGYDPLVQAFSGIMSVTGEAERKPVRVGVSLVDVGTGAWAAVAVLAALLDRTRTGRGRVVDLSLLETALAFLPYQVADVLAGGARARPARHRVPADRPLRGVRDRRRRADGGRRQRPPVRSALRRARAAGAARRPGVRDQPRRAWRRATGSSALLASRFLERPAGGAGSSALRAAGVPAAPVQDVAEAAGHPQTRALGLDPGARRPRGAVAALHGRRRAAALSRRAPPLLGEHTRAVLREVGLTDADVDELAAAGVVETVS